ncbi:hypothetical protein [Streptomyces blattellae]|uniref:hypothetical protein n=1 Tax=Streptomyces blattellae TaxID=2569855 RepID=UPI0038B6AAC3
MSGATTGATTGGPNMPVLLLLAGSSRTHDTYEVAERAVALLPHLRCRRRHPSN